MAIDDYADKAVETTRKSKLPLNEQDKYISELNDTLNVLTDRLNPVLTPEQESPMKEPGDRTPVPPKSEMQMRLDEHNYQIRKAISKVNSILERLEV